MNWILAWEIAYVIIVILVCLRIVWDTPNITKALAYLLLVIFVPAIGIFFYFSFGINYRKRKMYSKKLIQDDAINLHFRDARIERARALVEKHRAQLGNCMELVRMLTNTGGSFLSGDNELSLLVNGENKFPEVLKVLKEAKHHIHIEYYIYEDDEIGREIVDILVEKAKSGVEVRFIYDAFGSWSLHKSSVREMQDAGIHVFPFSRLRFFMLANRLNYRNHRKIIVVDGSTAFVGGINVSKRYVNRKEAADQLFWRDTHLKIAGSGVYYLQYLFLCDWNFCSGDKLEPTPQLFPDGTENYHGHQLMQVAASGPDSPVPTILYSMVAAINIASEEILITTPYFIPGESIMDAVCIAARGGVKVKILVPGQSDSLIVNAAARSYYGNLLDAGVEIYLYHKGFVHAKTLVTDGQLAMVGTANMDNRSFDLNFEVNAVVYDRELAGELRQVFHEDIKDADRLDAKAWNDRPAYKLLVEKCARLISPML